VNEKDDVAEKSLRREAARERLRALWAQIGDDASDEKIREAFMEAVKKDPDLLLPGIDYLNPFKDIKSD
jgi:hypothetical protein